jgi:hypothetical protein
VGSSESREGARGPEGSARGSPETPGTLELSALMSTRPWIAACSGPWSKYSALPPGTSSRRCLRSDSVVSWHASTHALRRPCAAQTRQRRALARWVDLRQRQVLDLAVRARAVRQRQPAAHRAVRAQQEEVLPPPPHKRESCHASWPMHVFLWEYIQL